MIFQLLRYACGECEKHEIEKESVESAIALVEYFRHNAIKVHSYIQSSHIDREPENIRSWFHVLPSSFKTSEAIIIAEQFKIEKRRVAEHLKKRELFVRTNFGEYSKVYS